MSAGHRPISVSLSHASIRELLFLKDLHSLMQPYVLYHQNKKNFYFCPMKKMMATSKLFEGRKNCEVEKLSSEREKN